MDLQGQEITMVKPLKDYYQRLRDVDILRVAEALGIAVLNMRTAGNRTLCPLHGDEVPSLSFKANQFRCFGCGEKGSTLDLVQKVKGLPLEETAEWFGLRFGLSPPWKKARPRSAARNALSLPAPRRKEIASPKPTMATLSHEKKILPEYFSIYEALLRLLPEGSGAEWIKSRGFSGDTAEGYRIRKIKHPVRTLSLLRQRFPDKLLLASGVAVKRKEESLSLLWGAEWMLLPIEGVGENAGRIIFLQGRTPIPEGKPEYVEILGGFPRPLFWTRKAKNTPRGEELFLTAGMMDAWAAEELGYPAVAVLGAQGLMDEIIRTLLPWTVKIGAGKASPGRNFAVTAAERFDTMGKRASIVDFPAGVKDWNGYLLRRRRSR